MSSSEESDDKEGKWNRRRWHDIVDHFDAQAQFNTSMLHHHAVAESSDVLNVRVTKKGKEGPSWKLWHACIDRLKDHLMTAHEY